VDRTPEVAAAWVERASRGDVDAVALLLERFLPGLRAYLRLRAGKVLLAKESSSDLAQSVCREILEHVDLYQYRGEAQFKQWLYTTALRKIAKRYEHYGAEKRDARREVPLADLAGREDAVDPALLAACQSLVTPSRQVMAREELERIERGFELLSEERREVILLSRFVGLSAREIGEQMERSEDSVRQLLHRALAELAEIVARPGHAAT
jgi:RNA polymerase sigma-70 factor (ECF subfamily)